MTNKKQEDLAYKLLMSTLLDYKARLEKLEKEINDHDGAIRSNTRSIEYLTSITDIHRTEIGIIRKQVRRES